MIEYTVSRNADLGMSDASGDASLSRKGQPPRPTQVLMGSFIDKLFRYAALGAACLTLALLVGILFSLVAGAWPAIHTYGLSFLTRSV